MTKKTVNVEEMVTIRGTVKLIKEYQELAELENLINKRKDEIKAAVMTKMEANGVTECKAGDFKVTIRESCNSGSVDKKKLEAKYPKAYADCYKAPKTAFARKFVVTAFTKSKSKSTTEIFNDIITTLSNKTVKA